MEWKEYPCEDCPKCGKNKAQVLSKSDKPYYVHYGEEAKCMECGHKGEVSVEDSECADIIWDELTFHDKYGNVEVRALSWKQPYASLMLHGKIETRVWTTKYRGWVLICASKVAYTGKQMSKISGTRQMVRSGNTLPDHNVPLAQAIAIGKLSEVRMMTKEDENITFVKYDESLVCHIYTDVQPIVPFDWKGSQGWRILSDKVKAQIKFL